MTLHEDQTRVLLLGIAPHRVAHLDGMSYVPAFDIRAMLNRVFGFAGWSLTELAPAQLLFDDPHELKNGKPGRKVAYRASMQLKIRLPDGGSASYDGTAVGETTMPDYKRADAHDTAIKSAESGALKRAASNLGDQFGLSLYNDGKTSPIVRKAWDGAQFQEAASTDE